MSPNTKGAYVFRPQGRSPRPLYLHCGPYGLHQILFSWSLFLLYLGRLNLPCGSAGTRESRSFAGPPGEGLLGAAHRRGRRGFGVLGGFGALGLLTHVPLTAKTIIFVGSSCKALCVEFRSTLQKKMVLAFEGTDLQLGSSSATGALELLVFGLAESQVVALSGGAGF